MAVSDPLQRLQIIQTPALKGWTVDQTCAFYGVSTSRFYEWRARFAAEGLEGLRDRSRRPVVSPARTSAELETRIVGMRKTHPRWGAHRIRDELLRAGVKPPAISTIHQVLRRHDLVDNARPRRPVADQRFRRALPNELWQLDAKEDWELAGGAVAQIIDIIDDHSRFLCALRAGPSLSEQFAWETLSGAVEELGTPQQLLADNAAWITGRFHGTVIEFERRCWLAGIDTIHGRPNHPQTQGKVERHHRTLTEWLTDQPRAATITELQHQLDRYRHHYNHKRPHQALGLARTPAEIYAATAKATPKPNSRTATFTRIVAATGVVNYSGWLIHIGRRWAGTVVTVTEQHAKLRITFGDELLASVALDRDLYPDRYISTGKPRGRPRRPRPA